MASSISSVAASTLPSQSPPATAASGNGGNSSATKKPFKIRDELLAPTRLAPKVQLLHHTRSLSIQVVAHEVFLLVLACTKCYAAAGKEPPRIGVLGGGSVGAAVVMTILANGYRADRIALSTRQPDRVPRCEALKAPQLSPCSSWYLGTTTTLESHERATCWCCACRRRSSRA